MRRLGSQDCKPATLREVKRPCGFFLEMSSPFPRPY
jgi:hypothetical protein